MRELFSPETREAVLQGLRSGLTLAEAAEAAGVASKTLKNWCVRGRAEVGTEHAAFVQAIDAARDAAARAEMSLDEFRGWLNKAVRSGSVSAMKLWIAVRDRELVDDDPDALDELNRRRADRRASVLDQLDRQTITNGGTKNVERRAAS